MTSNTVITVSGYPGSGTTTVASSLSTSLDATYINGGDVFRALADERGMTVGEFGKYVIDILPALKGEDSRALG